MEPDAEQKGEEMNELKIGTTPTGTEGRDAVHVAIVPAKASTTLMAGTPVGLNAKGEAEANPTAIGVVDPFRLNRRVAQGEWFWLCLYPNTITGMRHVWQHPAFPVDEKATPAPEPVASDLSRSIEWVRDYVRTWCHYWGDEGYDEFLRYVREDRMLFYYGSDCHSLEDVHDAENLFYHLSVIVGVRIDASYFETYSCSC
jgi:hypothetical protein